MGDVEHWRRLTGMQCRVHPRRVCFVRRDRAVLKKKKKTGNRFQMHLSSMTGPPGGVDIVRKNAGNEPGSNTKSFTKNVH